MLVLFDIDGTLLTTGGAGGTAWGRAFQDLYRVPASVEDYTEAGMPDHEVCRVTFVHVLNLQDGWAYCADLPKGLWDEPAGAEALAVSPDGRTLYIVDAARGLVAEMNTRTLRVPRIVRVDLAAAGEGRISAQVSADGRTLFVGGGASGGGAIAAIDVATLALRDRWTVPTGVSGLGLTGDGADLVVALGDRLLTVDPATGRTLSTMALGGLGSILRVGTPGV